MGQIFFNIFKAILFYYRHVFVSYLSRVFHSFTFHCQQTRFYSTFYDSIEFYVYIFNINGFLFSLPSADLPSGLLLGWQLSSCHRKLMFWSRALVSDDDVRYNFKNLRLKPGIQIENWIEENLNRPNFIHFVFYDSIEFCTNGLYLAFCLLTYSLANYWIDN